MKLPCIAAGLLLVALPARAEFMTGNDLHDICFVDIKSSQCGGVILGHVDMLLALGSVCPRMAGAQSRQVIDVVKKFLIDNPADRNVPAAYMSAYALKEAFGCTTPTPPKK